MNGCGKMRTSKTDLTKPIFAPKGRKKRKGSKYWMRDWFEKEVSQLPKGKWRSQWEEWLKDPENGLTW